MNKKSHNEIKLIADLFLEKELKEFRIDNELVSIKHSIKEYKFCYSIGWCLKSEEKFHWSKRTLFVGGGPILISKVSNDIEMTGSSPTIDFVKEFEAKIRGLELYWHLEIEFENNKLTTLKTLLNLTTPELISHKDQNKLIFLDFDELQSFQILHDLKNSGISCVLEQRNRLA